MKKNGKLRPEVIAIGGLVAAALLVLVAGYLLLVSPQRSKMSSLSSQIQTAQTEVIVAQGTAAKPVPFRASDLFRLAKAMPSGSDMPGIILNLTHLAQQSKVQLTSVRPSPPVVLGSGYSAVQVAISVSGNYVGITKFTHLLRTAVRMNKAGDLKVSGRLFDGDNISMTPLMQTPTGPPPSSGAAAPTTTEKVAPNQLTATLALDAFVFGGAPSPAGLAGSGVAANTTTTATTTTGSGS
jgi:Tfp pilus assembly protein PilO